MSRPWMPLYVADYQADTAHLSTAEHGAYLLLIMFYWTKGGLPEDEEAIRRITRMTTRQWSQSRDVLRSLFSDGWRHKRIDEELAKAFEKSQVNSANAKRRHSDRTANADRTHTQPQPQSDIVAVADDAREAEKPKSGLVGHQAYDLAEKLLEIAGHSRHAWPPGWCGAPLRVKTWLEQGWQPEIILAAVEASARRKQGPPASSVQFFEKAIAEEHAKQAAPMPKVEIRETQTITVTHGTAKPQSGGSLLTSIRRELASVEAQIADLAVPGDAVLSIPDRSVRRP